MRDFRIGSMSFKLKQTKLVSMRTIFYKKKKEIYKKHVLVNNKSFKIKYVYQFMIKLLYVK